jgi:hypothetical protein
LKAVEWDSPDRADDDPRAVKLMIDYLYLGDYDAGTPTVTDPIPPVTIEHAVEARQTLQPREDPWNFDTGSIAPPPQSEFNEDMWGAPPTKKKKGKKFRVPAAEPPPDISPLEMHAKMFAIASKYEIKSLEQTACEKFKAEFDRDWSTPDLIAAIDVVCNHTPDRKIELRNALKDAIARHAATLVEQPDFGKAVASIDGLAYELFSWKTAAMRKLEDSTHELEAAVRGEMPISYLVALCS